VINIFLGKVERLLLTLFGSVFLDEKLKFSILRVNSLYIVKYMSCTQQLVQFVLLGENCIE